VRCGSWVGHPRATDRAIDLLSAQPTKGVSPPKSCGTGMAPIAVRMPCGRDDSRGSSWTRPAPSCARATARVVRSRDLDRRSPGLAGKRFLPGLVDGVRRGRYLWTDGKRPGSNSRSSKSAVCLQLCLMKSLVQPSVIRWAASVSREAHSLSSWSSAISRPTSTTRRARRTRADRLARACSRRERAGVRVDDLCVPAADSDFRQAWQRSRRCLPCAAARCGRPVLAFLAHRDDAA